MKNLRHSQTTYEQAKKIALRVNPSVNACREYKIAYHFYTTPNSAKQVTDNDVVVLKATEKNKPYRLYIRLSS